MDHAELARDGIQEQIKGHGGPRAGAGRKRNARLDIDDGWFGDSKLSELLGKLRLLLAPFRSDLSVKLSEEGGQRVALEIVATLRLR